MKSLISHQLRLVRLLEVMVLATGHIIPSVNSVITTKMIALQQMFNAFKVAMEIILSLSKLS